MVKVSLLLLLKLKTLMCTAGSLAVVTSEIWNNKKGNAKFNSLTFSHGSCWNSSENQKNLMKSYCFKALSPVGSCQNMICTRMASNHKITEFVPKSTLLCDHSLSLIFPCQPLAFSIWPSINCISRCAAWFISSSFSL